MSRGDFTAAAGWFCFSFDCFSLVCATATSDKHANPNTKILLFIFSLLCAGNGRHWLSRSERQTSYPHCRLRDVGRLRRAPQVTEVLPGRVARAPSPAKIPSMQPRASPLVRFRKDAASEPCPERSRKVSNRLPLVIPRHLLTTATSSWIMALTSPRLGALL